MLAGGALNSGRAAIGPYPAPRNEAYVGGRALTSEGHNIQIFMNSGLRKIFGAVPKN